MGNYFLDGRNLLFFLAVTNYLVSDDEAPSPPSPRTPAEYHKVNHREASSHRIAEGEDRISGSVSNV